MKTRGLQRSERGRQRGLDHRGVRTDKSPPVSGEYPYPEPALCVGCGAVYLRKTWRRSDRRRLGAYLQDAERVSCPACRQVGEGRGYGHVLLRGAGLADREDEVRRRIAAVESRARLSQPERRLVEVAEGGDGLEVITDFAETRPSAGSRAGEGLRRRNVVHLVRSRRFAQGHLVPPSLGEDTESPAPRKRQSSDSERIVGGVRVKDQ